MNRGESGKEKKENFKAEIKVYSKWSYVFLDIWSSECTCARKSTGFVSRIV